MTFTSAATTFNFQEFSRRYSIAERSHQNTRHAQRSVEKGEAALALMQAIEAEFRRCFRPVAEPDWDRVERAAQGLLGEGA
jgi:hypothetical protein